MGIVDTIKLEVLSCWEAAYRIIALNLEGCTKWKTLQIQEIDILNWS